MLTPPTPPQTTSSYSIPSLSPPYIIPHPKADKLFIDRIYNWHEPDRASPTLAGLHCKLCLYVCWFACGHIPILDAHLNIFRKLNVLVRCAVYTMDCSLPNSTPMDEHGTAGRPRLDRRACVITNAEQWNEVTKGRKLNVLVRCAVYTMDCSLPNSTPMDEHGTAG